MPDVYWYSTLAVVAASLAPVLLILTRTKNNSAMVRLVCHQVTALSSVNNAIGSTVAWLTLVMVLIQFAVVVMRYAYGVNFIALQESVLYAHGAMFTLASGYTLLQDGHVRVDIFYQNMPDRTKATVDLLGTLFLLVPFMLTILYFSWDYVANAWRIQEGSRESSGLVYLYLLKTVLLMFPALLLAQGIALAGKSALIISGHQASRDAP